MEKGAQALGGACVPLNERSHGRHCKTPGADQIRRIILICQTPRFGPDNVELARDKCSWSRPASMHLPLAPPNIRSSCGGVGTLEAFAIYVGLVARPIGAAGFRAARGGQKLVQVVTWAVRHCPLPHTGCRYRRGTTKTSTPRTSSGLGGRGETPGAMTCNRSRTERPATAEFGIGTVAVELPVGGPNGCHSPEDLSLLGRDDQPAATWQLAGRDLDLDAIAAAGTAGRNQFDRAALLRDDRTGPEEGCDQRCKAQPRHRISSLAP